MGPFFVATPNDTRLDDVATLTYRGAPDDLARLGFAVAHALDPKAPVVEDLNEEIRVMAEAIAGDLKAAERPLIVSGISLKNFSLVQAAANIAFALCDGEHVAGLAFLTPEANTMGVAMMDGMDLDGALELVRNRLRKDAADHVIILENDLYQRMAPEAADALLGAGQVVAFDYLETGTTRRADLVLPSATFAECTGTLVNYEGRAQRFFQVFEPEGDPLPAHRRLARMVGMKRNGGVAWDNLDAVTDALAAEMPIFAPLLSGGLAPSDQLKGMKVPRQSPRYSGRTSMQAHRDVNVPTPTHDPDAPLSFSMEGFHGPPPPALIPRYWAPGLELGPGTQQISGGGRRPLAGRRSRTTVDRAFGSAPYGLFRSRAVGLPPGA